MSQLARATRGFRGGCTNFPLALATRGYRCDAGVPGDINWRGTGLNDVAAVTQWQGELVADWIGLGTNAQGLLNSWSGGIGVGWSGLATQDACLVDGQFGQITTDYLNVGVAEQVDVTGQFAYINEWREIVSFDAYVKRTIIFKVER